MRHSIMCVAVLGLGSLAVGGGNAVAAIIEAGGYDLLTTPAGGGSLVLEIPGGGGETLTVPLQGNPIGPFNTDTIVYRSNELGDGVSGTIAVELVELSLISVDPIDLGLDTLVDVLVTLDHSENGLLTVTHDDPNGGTFDSFFDIFVKVDLVKTGTSESVLGLLGIDAPIPIEDTLESFGTAWSHDPPSGYPETAGYPSGGFYITAAGIDHQGPHGDVVPAEVPEPATIVIWSLLGALGLVYGWRRRKAA